MAYQTILRTEEAQEAAVEDAPGFHQRLLHADAEAPAQALVAAAAAARELLDEAPPPLLLAGQDGCREEYFGHSRVPLSVPPTVASPPAPTAARRRPEATPRYATGVARAWQGAWPAAVKGGAELVELSGAEEHPTEAPEERPLAAFAALEERLE